MSDRLIIDMNDWERKEYYDFFGRMDNPFFGITAKADFTRCFLQAKDDGESFMLYSLHRILKAVNRIPEFRCRIENGSAVIYDRVGASPTIGRGDKSFGFGYFDYYEDRAEFTMNAKKEVERVKSGSGLCLAEGEARTDLIYYSSIPWLDFTGISHAGDIPRGQSIPKVTTGKLVRSGDRFEMSVSVELNHALADGYHVARFFSELDTIND